MECLTAHIKSDNRHCEEKDNLLPSSGHSLERTRDNLIVERGRRKIQNRKTRKGGRRKRTTKETAKCPPMPYYRNLLEAKSTTPASMNS